MKDFQMEIAIIKKIEELSSEQVSLPLLEGQAYITKINREFELSFEGIFRNPEKGLMDMVLKGKSYKITSHDFDSSLQNLFRNLPAKHTFSINGMYKGNIMDKSKFRMFFFDTSNGNRPFYLKLESPKHDGVIPWAFHSVRINTGKAIYDIVQHEQDSISYIVIENLTPVDFENFQKDSYAIQKGIGFLTGYMPGGEHYIFSDTDFQYNRLARVSLKSIYYPVTSNPSPFSYEFSNSEKEEMKSFKDLLIKIPSSVISTFVTQIRDNEDLSVAILFLIEVSHLKSIVSMPGVFSVILESLANIIINPSQMRSNLITDKKLAQKIVSELNTVLDKYTSRIHPDAVIKIRRRIAVLNSPIKTQKITNAMKLREPFDQLGIPLSPSDEKAIDYRNYLLHGNILMNDGSERSSEEIDDHMFYISSKLYTLISKLLLKNCGFSGYVINHAKFRNGKNIQDESDYFELI
ncbi:hypothetical protein FMM05_13195 [Flavobacterium zepuense]|uniref:ApeA N-terminal domain-containing protein n=2 Tax=Flavobacterium zepuense TaxID=2593302 RepID=A0A552UZH3_9FLAO|nr:hypothetical protein FMM05_13195 [Flavobacterium zepuense]